jgi:RNA polymerase sigma factor (sigma-70 family)
MSVVSPASLSSASVYGDEQASADDLFARYHPTLERYLARLTGDPDLAADVAQEAFLRLLDRNPRPEAVRPWLFRVATNLVRDAARRSTRHRTLALDGRAPSAHGDPPPPPDTGVDRDRCRRLVREALDQLSAKERTALLMREEGFRHREIAEAIGTTTGSVGTLLSRAIRKAAHRLGEPGEVS